MKTKHEIMTELIDKADWLIEHKLDKLMPGPSKKWFAVYDEYTCLRAELSEAEKDGTGMSAEEVLYDTTGMLGENHPSIIKAMHEFASQSSKMPTEEIKKALQIAEYAPELNMANYDDDQVRELNNAMIELCHILRGITESSSETN